MNLTFCKKNEFYLVFGGIALILLILWNRIPEESIWISDEGNRIMTAQAFAVRGSAILPDPLEGLQVPEGVRAYPPPYFIQKAGHWRTAYPLLFPYVSSFALRYGTGFLMLFLIPLAGILTILLTGWIARQMLKDDRKAEYAMGMVAFASPLLFYTGTFLETVPAAFWMTLSVWLFLNALDSPQEKLRLFLCGLAAGLSVCLREEGILLAGGIGAGILLLFFRWSRVLIFGIGCAIPVGILTVTNFLDSGSILGMHSMVYHSLWKPLIPWWQQKLSNISFYLFMAYHPWSRLIDGVLGSILCLGIIGAALPKIGKWVRDCCLGLLAAAAAVSLYFLLHFDNGGFYGYQSLLVFLPFFGVVLYGWRMLFREPDLKIRFLLLLTMIGIILPPFFLNSSLPGIFWGGRHFVNIVPLLSVLTIFLLTERSSGFSRFGRYCGWLLILLALGINLTGWQVLRMKKEHSVRLVRELSDPQYQVIVTDVFWLPEELAWISRNKCVLYLTRPDSLDSLQRLFRQNGIRRFGLILSPRHRRLSGESLRCLVNKATVRTGPHFHTRGMEIFEVQIYDVELR